MAWVSSSSPGMSSEWSAASARETPGSSAVGGMGTPGQRAGCGTAGNLRPDAIEHQRTRPTALSWGRGFGLRPAGLGVHLGPVQLLLHGVECVVADDAAGPKVGQRVTLRGLRALEHRVVLLPAFDLRVVPLTR